MEFLTGILAKLFDSFKASNPKTAAFLILIFGGIIWLSENGLQELIGTDLSVYVKWVAFLLAALQGSRTTYILSKR